MSALRGFFEIFLLVFAIKTIGDPDAHFLISTLGCVALAYAIGLLKQDLEVRR